MNKKDRLIQLRMLVASLVELSESGDMNGTLMALIEDISAYIFKECQVEEESG